VTRPFNIVGVQQIAIGHPSKAALRSLWVDLLGVPQTGSYRSERENVDEDILSIAGVEIDLMEPVDAAKSPKVHDPRLNHIGLWAGRRRMAHRARRAVHARRHSQRGGGARRLLYPSERQRRRAAFRRGRADRAGAGAASTAVDNCAEKLSGARGYGPR
jgi:hypothetical protein